MRAKHPFQPFHAVQPVSGVRRLRHAVRIFKQLIPFVQLQYAGAVTHFLHARQNEAGAYFFGAESIFPTDKRHFVSRVHEAEFPRHEIENALERRYEQSFAVALAQQPVDFPEHFAEIPARRRMIFDERFPDDHKQRGGYPFSRNVRHYNGQMTLVHHKEIVKVAAHFLGRRHRRIDIELPALGESGENAGKHGRLNVTRDVQFRADPLFFRRHFSEIVYIFPNVQFHSFQRVAQEPQFVSRTHGQRCDGRRKLPVPAAGYKFGGSARHPLDRTDKNVIEQNIVQHGKYGRDARQYEQGAEQIILPVANHAVHRYIRAHIAEQFPAFALVRIGNADDPAVLLVRNDGGHPVPRHQVSDDGIETPFVIFHKKAVRTGFLRFVGIEQKVRTLFGWINHVQVQYVVAVFDVFQ